MIERILILSVLVIAGTAAYRFCCFWHVRYAAVGAAKDPLLRHYQPGIPAVMLFTADYCYPCKSQQQPAIQRLIEQVGKEQVQYIQVNVEADPESAQRWGVMSLPTTFILDGDGTPREVNHGVTSTEKLKRQIEAVA